MGDLRIAIVVLLVASALPAAAEDQAKILYSDGEAAFEQGDFIRAHQLFKQAYNLSKAPALLYDMGSALERAHRPSEAAQALRAYLKATTDEPDRPAIEARIVALDETQRILDAERLKNEPPKLIAPIAPPPPPKTHKKMWIAIGAGAAVVVGGALGLGLGLGLRNDFPASTLHTHVVTP